MSKNPSCPSLQEQNSTVFDSTAIVLRDGVPSLVRGGIIGGNPGGQEHLRCTTAAPLYPNGKGIYIFADEVSEQFCRAAYDACPFLKEQK